MSDTAKYTVITKFAHFKVGQVVELSVPCPSAAEAHVKLHVEAEEAKDDKVEDSAAVAALKEIYTLATGNKPGRKGAETLGKEIIDLITKSDAEPEPEKEEPEPEPEKDADE